MAKRITTLVGISLLVVPWFCSVAFISGIFGLLEGTQVDALAARNTFVSLLNGHVLSGLSAMMGIMALGFSIDGMGYRPKWLLWVIAGLGVVWLPFYAAGTMLGVALILYTIFNYRNFYPKPTNA